MADETDIDPPDDVAREQLLEMKLLRADLTAMRGDLSAIKWAALFVVGVLAFALVGGFLVWSESW